LIVYIIVTSLFFIAVPIEYEIKLTVSNNEIFSLFPIKYFDRIKYITYHKK